MSRLKYFSRSLLMGYGTLGATVVFTLVSVPLALSYLPAEEYGLWGLVIQIVHFLQLAEMGMTGACARILIDHKDNRDSLNGMVKITTVLFLAVGLFIGTTGYAMAPLLPTVLEVPAHLQGTFTSLVRLYALAFALGYVLRPFHVVLFAFQRNDLVSAGVTLSFAVQLTVLWLGLRAGYGLWSFLLAYGAGVVLQSLVCFVACLYLRLLSIAALRQPFRRDWCREVLRFAGDRALVIVGLQVLTALPVILISKFLGLEAVAAWVVGTRLFVLSRDVLYRLQDTAYPALAEMITRGERDRFSSRFQSLSLLTLALAGAAAAMIGGLNKAFVGLWTGGQIAWSSSLDLTLAGWLLVSVSVHSNWVAISITKEIRSMRFVYFAEALLTALVAGITLAAFTDLIWMPWSILICSLALSYPYTAWRTADLLGRSAFEVGVTWLTPALVVMVPSLVAGTLVRIATSSWAPWAGLGVTGGVILSVGIVLLLLQPAIQQPLREAVRRRRVII